MAERQHTPLWLRLASTFFWVFLTVSSIAVFPFAVLIWIVTKPFDSRKRLLHQFTCFWGASYTWLNPAWPITIEGREHIDPEVAYVMVANHQSLLDILVLFRLFRHFKWVSKEANFRIPVIGLNMRMNDYVPLKRGDQKSIADMMHACDQHLQRGSSVMLFPEGTRSRDGRLKPFKHGAFTLALRSNTPILPIVVEGTGNALPKAGFILRGRHPIRVRILPPIAPDAWPPSADSAQLAQHVRNVFLNKLAE